MNRIVISVLSIFCISIAELYSQELFIKDVMLQNGDKTAIIDPYFDNNGDTCALVRIITDGLIGLEFDNSEQYIIARTPEKGIYEVYMPYSLNKLSYKHREYLSGQINFADFGYRRLKQGKTYVVRIESTAARGKVVLKVQPSSSVVIFDYQEVAINESGIYEFPVSSGVYQYSVKDLNYVPFQGIVQVDCSEVKMIPLSLKPILHPVYITCNVDGANVYIDGLDYGCVGSHINIAQGIHQIRLTKDNYLDLEDTIKIDSSITHLSYTLEKNKNILEIHAIPITIYSKSKKIYKNNKEIKEWNGSGTVVKFMPGKYLISDDRARSSMIIEVVDKPFTINL